MIIATAGHVDHGKTSLVKALTGIDTDRLAEEKRRGLSINLGYAYLPTPAGLPLGFIDVPGHRRFINTMIAGISGIDLGLLVVAADDGPMPQTLEHLDVLEQLGVPELVVVISKTGRVEAQRVASVKSEVSALVNSRCWPPSLVFPVDSLQGEGTADLEAYLQARAAGLHQREQRGQFRLSLDRAFSIKGSGLVVTGTVASGRVQVGDTLQLLSGDAVRVRGLRVHDGEAEAASAGQRCAINLAGGPSPQDLSRGSWLLAEPSAQATQHLDAEIRLLDTAPFSLKHLAPVKLHLGAGRIAARLALLDREEAGNRLQPGEQRPAQLLLEHPVVACRGDRFLLRDHAEEITLGGGIVLDPFPHSRRRLSQARRARLGALALEDPARSLAALVSSDQLLALEQTRLTFNLKRSDFLELLPDSAQVFNAGEREWIVSERRWRKGEATLLSAVSDWHTQQPAEQGIAVAALKQAVARSLEPPLLLALLNWALGDGKLRINNGLVSRADFQPAASGAARAGWQAINELLMRAGRQIPVVTELAQTLDLQRPKLQALLDELTGLGRLRRISEKRYALPDVLQDFAREVTAMADAGTPLTVVEIKQRFGIGRNLAIEVLEYFDRTHFTRRLGDLRVIHDPAIPEKGFTR